MLESAASSATETFTATPLSLVKNEAAPRPSKSPKRKQFKEVDFELVMRPLQPGMSWESFKSEAERFDVALDGYVNGPTAIDFENAIANFDHHEGCNRLATRATCAQIFMEIQAGLFNVFRDQRGPRVRAHVNDRDEDDALSCLLLQEPNLIINDTHGVLRDLVCQFDVVDSAAGMYPVNFDDPKWKKIFYMTEPYRADRNDIKATRRKDVGEYTAILVEMQNRIKKYLVDPENCPQIEADTDYEVISDEDGWVMIDEIGNQARMAALADGNTAIVSHKNMGKDKNGKDLHRYIFALTSTTYHPYFPLAEMIEYFNTLEGCTVDKWGGNGHAVMGSPRDSFSKIPPEEMVRHIREVVEKARIKNAVSDSSSTRLRNSTSIVVPSAGEVAAVNGQSLYASK